MNTLDKTTSEEWEIEFEKKFLKLEETDGFMEYWWNGLPTPNDIKQFIATQKTKSYEEGRRDAFEYVNTVTEAAEEATKEQQGLVEKEAYKRVLELLPKEVDCEEPGCEMPTYPGLAADQARNHTIRVIRTKINKLIKEA